MTNIVIATSFLLITNWVTTSTEVVKNDGENKTNYYQSGVVSSNTIRAEYHGTNIVFKLERQSDVVSKEVRVTDKP